MTWQNLSITKRLLKIFLGLSLLLAGIAHLSWARGEFLAQVPKWVPLDGDLVVVLSGIVEIVLGALLIFLVAQDAAPGPRRGPFLCGDFSGQHLSVYK